MDWWYIAECADCGMKQPFDTPEDRDTWAMRHSSSTPKGTHKVKVYTEDRRTHQRVTSGAIVLEPVNAPGTDSFAVSPPKQP